MRMPWSHNGGSSMTWEHVLWPLCPAEFAVLLSASAPLLVSWYWRQCRLNMEGGKTEFCSLFLQFSTPKETDLAVPSMLPTSPKTVLVLTQRRVMQCLVAQRLVNEGLLKKWVCCGKAKINQILDYIIFCWKLLSPKTQEVMRMEQRCVDVRKELDLVVF